MRERAHRSRDFSIRNAFPSIVYPLPVPLDFIVPDRELQPERDGLAMNPMRAADHHGAAMFKRPFANRHQQPVDALQDHVGGFDHQDGQGGIKNVRRGESHVKITRSRTDLLRDRFDEGDHVMLDHRFQRIDTRRVHAGLGLDLTKRQGRHKFLLNKRFTGE